MASGVRPRDRTNTRLTCGGSCRKRILPSLSPTRALVLSTFARWLTRPSFAGSRKQVAKAQNIALSSHKGSVAKTTLTVSIANALARPAQKVLIVDADPQRNALALHLPEPETDKLPEESSEQNGEDMLRSALRRVRHRSVLALPRRLAGLTLPAERHDDRARAPREATLGDASSSQRSRRGVVIDSLHGAALRGASSARRAAGCRVRQRTGRDARYFHYGGDSTAGPVAEHR